MLRSSDSRRPGEERGSPEGSQPSHALKNVFADRRGRLPRRSLALFFTLILALMLGSAPALALGQRGHVFSFAFGTEGTGEEQFDHPSGIAVDNSNGYVYVADRSNNRVEQFKPKLNAKEEWVNHEYVVGPEFKVPSPESVAVDNCTNAGKPCTTSEDPSVGDVYVVGAKSIDETKEPGVEIEEARIYKFNHEGTLIFKLSRFKLKGSEAEDFEERIEGLAVATNGDLFSYLQHENEIYKFSNAEKNEGLTHVKSLLSEEAKPGFALDSHDNFYVGTLTEGEEPHDEEEAVKENELLEQIVTEASEEGIAELAVVAKLEGTTGKVVVPETGTRMLDYEDTTAVAVNPAGEPGNDVEELNDVYLDNLAVIGGKDVTTVAQFTPEGKLVQRFGLPGLTDGDGIAVDSHTGAVYVTDSTADKVDVFELEPRGLPAIGNISACTLDSSNESACPKVGNAALLRTQVDPTGAKTKVDFEYGSGSCSTVPSPCATSPQEEIGEGFDERPASLELEGLKPGLYHYRVVATNEFGTVRSAEQTFTVFASASGLPDGRAWELVSPPAKDGAEPEAISEEGGTIRAAEDGDAITYVSTGPIPAGSKPEGSRNPEFTQILSTHGLEGWETQDIVSPTGAGLGIHVGTPAEYQAFSANLALGLMEPYVGTEGSGPLAEPPLSPPVSAEEVTQHSKEEDYQQKTIYLRDDEPLQPEASEVASYMKAKENGELMTPRNAGFLPLVTKASGLGGEFGGGEKSGTHEGLEFLDATPDLSHVVFKSNKAAPGLYEWGPKESVQLVSVLPGGARAPGESVLGGGDPGKDVRNAISTDGSRIFWSTPEHLYVRDTDTQETLEVGTVQPGASGAGPANPQFQVASVNGSRVFFTDTQRLTPGSLAHFNAPDLYVVELSGGNGPGSPLSGTLHDLTPEGTDGESADLQATEKGGGIPGTNKEGTTVYFVANAVLSNSENAEGEKARRGACLPESEEQPPGATCNLYVRQYNGTAWEPTKFIAALSAEDAPDWDVIGEPGDPGYMTSRVSPNGDYLAFMSDRSLTGYDNEDVTSEKSGERLDEEVYLYENEAGSERLVCASCNPSGERPAGVEDLGAEGSGGIEGEGLVVDRLQIWASTFSTVTDHWLAGSVPGWTGLDPFRAIYQSRYLSDSGRLFFNSPDHLVPAATGDKEKVYEYERNGVGSCDDEAGCVGLISAGASKPHFTEHESAFLDASASGNDVFFLTAEKLVPQDEDGNFDVYDAHVCEPSSPCPTAPLPPPPPCTTVEACRPGSYSSGASESPASETPSGSGNVAKKQVLSLKETGKPAPKPLTRAQKLANALKACKKDKKKRKRLACERQARKQYGPKKAAKAKKSSRRGK